MPIQNNITGCECEEFLDQTDVEQTLYLGLSILSVSASLGWNGQASQYTATLVEDTCAGDKVCWNACLVKQNVNIKDPGFFGEPRWVDGDNEYSHCSDLTGSSTKVREAIDLEGLPTYLRVGDFELCGIIVSWSKSKNSSGQVLYTVQIADPRIILEKVHLIIGNYSGGVALLADETAGAGICAPPNIINVFGFAEQFGTYCPPVIRSDLTATPWTASCTPGDPLCCPNPSYDPCSYNVIDGDFPTDLSPPMGPDGVNFGSETYPGGFGGSLSTESGMPVAQILQAFNLLANSLPILDNKFSPYGRVVYCHQSLAPISNAINSSYDAEPCGLMIETNGATLCTGLVSEYFVDISELPLPRIYSRVSDSSQYISHNGPENVADTDLGIDYNYKVSGQTITLLDLVNTMADDLGFDYYIDMVPIRDLNPPPCVTKFIKVRVVDRDARTDLGQVCDFVSNVGPCVTDVEYGRELRTESNGTFIIGAPKQTIFQACQHSNVDQFVTPISNNDETIGAWNPYINSVQTSTTPLRYGGGNNQYIDDAILPYFGVYPNGNTINVEYDSELGWGADFPIGAIQSKLTNVEMRRLPIIDTNNTIRVYEEEMMCAQSSYDDWFKNICTHKKSGCVEGEPGKVGDYFTETGALLCGIYNLLGVRSELPDDVGGAPIEEGAGKGAGKVRFSTGEFTTYDIFATKRDAEEIHNWINTIANTFRARSFAVRIPFVSCFPNTEKGTIEYSSVPTNSGWTEVANVLDLPNNLTTFFQDDSLLKYFKTGDGRIIPFVKFGCGLTLNTTKLSEADYIYAYKITDTLAGQVVTGSGPPAGVGEIYVDTDTNNVYVQANINSTLTGWKLLTDIPIFVSQEEPTFCLNNLVKNDQPDSKTDWFYDSPETALLDNPKNLIYTKQLTLEEDDFPVVWIDPITCNAKLLTELDESNAVSTTVYYEDTEGHTLFVNKDIRTFCPGTTFKDTIQVDLYVKARIEPDYQFFDKSTCFAPKAIVNLPAPITVRNQNLFWEPSYRRWLRSLCQTDSVQSRIEFKEYIETLGSEDGYLFCDEFMSLPEKTAIPILHNTLNYGPWTQTPNGPNISIEQNDTLVPWNYGSYAQLNMVANYLVASQLKGQKAGEIGKICVPGYPTVPLGAELGAVSGLGGYTVVETRPDIDSLTVSNFSGILWNGSNLNRGWSYISYPTGVWNGIYGPNITNINVSVNLQTCNITTCYDLRTFFPKRFGDRFNKQLVDRLQNSLRVNNELREKYNDLKFRLERLEAAN